MKFRRKIALLASCAMVLQGLLAALPVTAIADDDLAGFVYWKLPLGSPNPDEATPSFGFSMIEAKNIWLMPTANGGAEFVPPALVDLRFSGGEEIALPSLSFSGVDVGTVVDNALYADTGPAPHTGEWILIGVGSALGGLTLCAALGCFDGDNDGGTPGSSSSAAAAARTTSFALDAPAAGMASSF